MKKLLWVILILAITFCVAGFVFYKLYLPALVADVLTKAETPSYVPAFVQNKIEKYKVPINKGAGDFVTELHRQNVPVQEVINTIDETSEEEIEAALNELKDQDIKTTDEAFDIIVRHVNSEMNLEIFRAPFKRNVEVKTIQKFLSDDDFNTYRESLDPAMVKEVAKKVLLEKEAEYNNSPARQ
jgi:hypothetical protein